MINVRYANPHYASYLDDIHAAIELFQEFVGLDNDVEIFLSDRQTKSVMGTASLEMGKIWVYMSIANRVACREGLDFLDTLNSVIVHELQHFKQYENGVRKFGKNEEKDADNMAYEIIGNYNMPKSVSAGKYV